MNIEDLQHGLLPDEQMKTAEAFHPHLAVPFG
jgi:hypothetical protein